MAAAQVTPLLGACSDGPACSLLQIGAFNILLDCGWSQQFELAEIDNLRIAVEEMRIDYVLLSHSDLEHVGALPMALSKFKLDAEVYGTWPVQKLGQLTLYEAYQNRCMEGEFSAFSLEDVDEAFNKMRPVKYSQNVILRKDNEVLVCVPMPAGHRVGSTVWKIRKEATDLIYAMSFNLRKESTLFGSALHTEKSASVFITDAHCIHATDARLKDRETKLVKTVLDCLRSGGNVLMPCDATGRVLELLYMLGRHWDANRIGTYDLVFLAHVAFSTLEFARSMLEWMADLSGRKNNPFEFRHVFICRSLQQMDALGPNPKLVLATDASLSSGMAKELLLRWGGDPQNLVLFTQRARPNTLAHTLMSTPPPIITQISIPVKVSLSGKELEEYKARKERANRLEQEAAQRHKQMQELQIFHNLQDEKEDREDDADETAEQPMSGLAASNIPGAQNVATPAMQRRMSVSGETAEANAERKRRRLEGLMKYTNPQHPMFTNVETKFEYDDFGVKVNPDDYKDITSSSLLPRHRYGFPRPGPGAEADGPQANGHDADDNRQFMPESSLQRMYKAVESEEVPTKIELHRQSVQFTCQVMFIDFMGLSDSSSVKKLLQQTNPKRVVIIGGSELATKQFAAAITPVVAEVYDPLPLTTVSCALDSAFARVRLPVSYIQSSEFNRSYINASRAAQLGTAGGGSADIDCWIAPVDNRLRFVHLGETSDGVPQIEVTPAQSEAAEAEAEAEAEVEGGKDVETLVLSASKPPMFGTGLAITYGDISLDDLRTRLLEGNVRADFELGARGGLLVCRQSGACIRKVVSDSGNENIFEVEGTPSEEFYALRRTLYSNFAFV